MFVFTSLNALRSLNQKMGLIPREKNIVTVQEETFKKLTLLFNKIKAWYNTRKGTMFEKLQRNMKMEI